MDSGLLRKTIRSIRNEGFEATIQRIKNYIHIRRVEAMQNSQTYEPCMDVLFINGCDPVAVPHPPRYRVTHQKEQLIANNVISNEVYYTALRLDQVRNYRVFIFFRCPYTELIGEFIRQAKLLHKVVLFDIDDLVIDTKYTDLIPYVRGLAEAEKAVYDDGVMRMGRTLSLCDAAITTTERLAEELGHYVPEVFINRNTASELMLSLSDAVRKKREAYRNERAGYASDKNVDSRRDGRDSFQDALCWDGIRIGYFSGSITHNADFEMILPPLVRILAENPDVELHVVGELDLPEALRPYQKQVKKREFVDWQKLPELIGSVDINLAPLESNIFNEAKSENKWVEAALVGVPTVASNFGAFQRMIQHNETGLLCDSAEDWYQALLLLIQDQSARERLAHAAYQFCRKNCVTIYTGFPLTKYIRGKMTRNVAFVLPSLEISGGIMVALKHASLLFEYGADVFIISEQPGNGWIEFRNQRFPVISKNHHPIYQRIDKAIATMWTTVQFLEIYPNIGTRYYLVQGFELEFYEPNIFLRIQASQSYSPSQKMRFLTVSRWCQRWLRESYEKEVRYAPNGIYAEQFRPRRRSLKGRIRLLIEGDCAVDYKNVDESFKIVDKLDPDRFEVWYMSYNAKPKKQYRINRFLHRVAYGKVFEVYLQCDILIKSSVLESFSYPPLEMMASGGYSVVAFNDGNAEYVRDGENCLLYQAGDIRGAVRQIERLCSDRDLQERLYNSGIETARARDWSRLTDQILALYDEEALGRNKSQV